MFSLPGYVWPMIKISDELLSLQLFDNCWFGGHNMEG